MHDGGEPDEDVLLHIINKISRKCHVDKQKTEIPLHSTMNTKYNDESIQNLQSSKAHNFAKNIVTYKKIHLILKCSS